MHIRTLRAVNKQRRKTFDKNRRRRAGYRPALESLEARMVLDAALLAGLEFVADQNFSTNASNQVSVSGPVVLKVAGDSRSLLKFSNGVTFQKNDPDGLFTPIGTVTLEGNNAAPLLNGNSHSPIKAIDLLPTGSGVLLSAADTNGVSPLLVSGINFSVKSLQIGGTANAYVVQMQGDVAIPALGDFSFSLPSQPQNVYVEAGVSDIMFAADFTVTLQNKTFTNAGLQANLQNLEVKYSRSQKEFDLRGTGSIQLPSFENPVTVSLGDPANANDYGITVVDGVLQKFTIQLDTSSSFSIGKLTIEPVSLLITYASPTKTYTISGAATFQVPQAESPILVQLGSPAQGDTPATRGIVITAGKLESFDLLVMSDAANVIKIGALTITPLSLRVTYQQDTNEANQTRSTYTITGAARFQISPQMSAPSTVRLGTAASESDPGSKGLVITNGKLTNLDLLVDNEDENGKPLTIDFNKLTITPKNLHFTYEISETNSKKFTFSGGVGVALVAGGETQFVSVELEQKDNVPGIVVENGILTNLRAKVTADFNFRKLKIGIDEVTLAYDKAADSYEFSGTIKVSAMGSSKSLVDLSATLGDKADKPGLVIKNGSVTDVLIVVNGGFSLKGFTLEARNLTISYDAVSKQLGLSGGVSVTLTESLNVNATISNDTPLLIDTNTGELTVSDKGLMIMGGLKLGSFSAMAMIKYTNSVSEGLSIDASVLVHLPQKIDLMGTFVLKSGQLSSISLKYANDIGTPIGATGFFLTGMEGGLYNLDSPDLTNLVVKGSLSIRFGKTIKLAGTNYDLLDAKGSFTIDKDHLELSASINLVGGKIGRGSGMVDINWSTGVFKVEAEIGLIDDLLVIRGSLYLDRIGNVTFTATVKVAVPKSIPVIGGLQLGEGALLLQIRPETPAQNLVAVTGEVGPCPFCISGGFQYNFDSGDFKFIGKLPTPAPAITKNFEYSHSFNASFAPGSTLYSVTIDEPEFNKPGFSADFYATVKDADDQVVYTARYTGPSRNSELPILGFNPDQRVIFLEQSKIPGFIPGRRYTATVTIASKADLNLDGITPKFDVTQEYAGPEIRTPEVTLLPNGTDVNISIPFANSFLDRNNAIVTLYYQSSLAGFEDGGRIAIKSFKVTDGTFLKNDDLGFLKLENYVWRGLPDLVNAAQLPYDRTKQPTIQIYAGIYDGVREAVFSPLSTVTLIPPNPVPDVTAPEFVEPKTPIAPDEPNQQALGVKLNEFVGLKQDIPLNVRVDVSIDQGGFFRSFDPDVVNGSTSFTFGACLSTLCSVPISGKLTEAQFLLSRVAFVASDNYTGLSNLTVTITSVTGDSGLQYSTTKVIPIIVKNAPLFVTQQIDNATPKDGDIVNFTIEVTNENNLNAVDAEAVKVIADLPSGVTFLESTNSVGAYDPDTGIWTIGDIPLNVATATLTIKARVNPGTEGTQLIATATATSDTRIVYPEYPTDAVAFHVVNTPLALDSLGPFDAVIGVPYPRYQIGLSQVNNTLQGGVGGPYQFFFIPDEVSIIEPGVRYELPPGLNLSEDGVISGIPTTSGVYQIPIGVYDGLGTFARKSYRINISSEPTLKTDVSYPNIKDYNDDPRAVSALFSVIGDLPPGLMLDRGTGVLSGQPTTAGFYQYTVQASYFIAVAGEAFPSFEVTSTEDALLVKSQPGVLTPASLPSTVLLGQAFPPTQLTALDQIGEPIAILPLTYLVTNGSGIGSEGVLPPGMTLTTDGVLQGTPTNFGTYTFTVIAVNGQRDILASADYSLTIANTAPVTLPGAAIGSPYANFLSAIGNSEDFVTSYAIASGDLPPGMTFSRGLLSGVPSALGSYNFVTKISRLVLDEPETVSYNITISPPMTIGPTVLPTLHVPAPDEISLFRQSLSVSGGSGEGYAFRLSGGSLSRGMNLTPEGDLIGAPRDAGSFRFTVEVTDSIGTTATQNFSLDVASWDSGTLNVAFSQALPDHRPASTFASTFALISGELPGLMLTTSGRITGTPTRDGFYRFTVSEVVNNLVDQTILDTYAKAYYLRIDLPKTPDLDFGDAPSAAQSGFADDYPVTLEQDGARHKVSALRLGTLIDAEPNGRPDEQAGKNGSNGDAIGVGDEDGVFVTASMVASGTVATTSSLFVTASDTGKLDAWIDFNQDGDWGDDGEQVFKNIAVAAGSNLLSFTIPSGSAIGSTGARFRLSSSGDLTPTGLAMDGEVEDYRFTLVDESPVSSLAFTIPKDDAEVVVNGDNIEFRQGSVVLFQAPADSFGELSFGGSVLDDILLFSIVDALKSNTLEFDGDFGKDVLKLAESGQTFDLTDTKITLRDVEGIDITGTGNNKLVISINKVKAASTTTDTLEVVANAGDSITFGTGWKAENPRFINGVFTHIVSETANGGTARVEIRNDRMLTNPLTPFDADRDGKIQALDALRIINELRRRGAGVFKLPTTDVEVSKLYFDVNADNRLTALDALRIINAIARINRGGSAEGEVAALTLSTDTPLDLNQFRVKPFARREMTDAGIHEIVSPKLARPLTAPPTPSTSLAAIDDAMTEYGQDDQTERSYDLQLLSTQR